MDFNKIKKFAGLRGTELVKIITTDPNRIFKEYAGTLDENKFLELYSEHPEFAQYILKWTVIAISITGSECFILTDMIKDENIDTLEIFLEKQGRIKHLRTDEYMGLAKFRKITETFHEIKKLTYSITAQNQRNTKLTFKNLKSLKIITAINHDRNIDLAPFRNIINNIETFQFDCGRVTDKTIKWLIKSNTKKLIFNETAFQISKLGEQNIKDLLNKPKLSQIQGSPAK